MKNFRHKIQLALRKFTLVATSVALCTPLAAQECDALEGEDLTVCLTLMVCMSLEDDRARNQCLEVARQVLDDHDAQRESPSQESDAASSDAVGQPDSSVGNDSDSSTQNTANEEAQNPASQRETATADPQELSDSDRAQLIYTGELSTELNRRNRWFSWLRRDAAKESNVDGDDLGFTVDGVPKQFAATVVSVNNAGYNDAMLVLSNRYVFIVKRVRQSRIEPGDVIIARKREGLSGRHAFLFYGRGASVDAKRVVCDHVDPSRKTRQRCEYAERQLGVSPL